MTLTRAFLDRIGLLDRLGKLWRPDVDAALKPPRQELRLLARKVAELERQLEDAAPRARRAERLALQVHLTTVLNQRQQARLADLGRVLDEARVTRHVRDVVASAPRFDDPFEHAVVEPILPEDVYALLLETLPPAAFFTDHDPVKQDLTLPIEFGPALSTVAWGFFEGTIAQRVLRTAILERFHEPLLAHYGAVFGDGFRDRAAALPQATSGGRLMLRRPGYHLPPHRDPKRASMTCLLYFARPGDSEAYGTQLFRVIGDAEATYKETYYPEQEGHTCELVKTVPFRPNAMLAFMNSRGAHGATIAPDAPAGLERYSYQCYVAPEKQALTQLIKSLPPERKRFWADKAHRTPGEPTA